MSEGLCEAVELATRGVTDIEIEKVCEHLWEWFWDAHRGRQSGMNGWLPLSAAEWQAWQQITGAIVLRDEWRILRDMDRAFLAAISSSGIPRSSEPMTAEIFDAMFG